MSVGADVKEQTQERAPDRGEARRQAFLEAAREVFMTQGYEAASVNDVVRIAGGSMATLYAQFGNKGGLFLAVMADQRERFARAITPECTEGGTLEQGLQAMGEHYLRALLDRSNLAFYRIVAGESRKFPQDLQTYIATGNDTVREQIARLIKSAKEQINDPEMVAGFLVDAWRSRHHFKALADESYAITDTELSAHIRAVNDLVLNGARPRT